MTEGRKALVVGLGNPGAQYAETRHNVGFMVLDVLARQLGFSFKQEKKFGSAIAKGMVKGEPVYLLKPLTFMNASGQAVRRCVDFYKLTPGDIIVVCDDVAIPFEEIRLRKQGSAGGHNGLKDVERHLGTQQYARLRIGVGDRVNGALADHVLSRFSADENQRLEPFLEKGTEVVRRLLNESIDDLMTEVNRRASKEIKEKRSPQSKGSGETENERKD